MPRVKKPFPLQFYSWQDSKLPVVDHDENHTSSGSWNLHAFVLSLSYCREESFFFFFFFLSFHPCLLKTALLSSLSNPCRTQNQGFIKHDRIKKISNPPSLPQLEFTTQEIKDEPRSQRPAEPFSWCGYESKMCL